MGGVCRWTAPLDSTASTFTQAREFVYPPCSFVERRFRYRKPLTCGYTPEAHVIADLGHPYQSGGDG